MSETMKQKKAFLAYSFSANNAGDFALTLAAIDILIKNNYSVTVVSRFKKDAKEYRETNEYYTLRYGSKLKMIESPFFLDREAGLLKKLFHNLYGIFVLIGWIKSRELIREIKDADITVMGGGNLLRCSGLADYMRLQALYYPLGIAKKYGKPFIIFPQSTAEINDMGKSLLGKFINGARLVFIREKLSYDKLKQLFPGSPLVETLDLAFFLQDETLFKASGGDRKKIAMTCRIDGIGGLRKFTDEEKNLVKTRIKETIATLKETCDFTFIIQAPHRDKEFTYLLKNEVKKELLMDIPVIEEHDPVKLIDLYSSFDLLLGMRLHSIILAACGGTPSYGLFFSEWGLKNPGIMKSLGLPYAIIEDQPINVEELKKQLDSKEKFQQTVSEFYKRDSLKFENALAEVI
jgi:polysaccharide pyruvyl transferase WcaK-like protein